MPPGLRDAHYGGAKKLGHGTTYSYPHAHPDGVVPQQYPPDALVGKDYYRPTGPKFAQLTDALGAQQGGAKWGIRIVLLGADYSPGEPCGGGGSHRGSSWRGSGGRDA